MDNNTIVEQAQDKVVVNNYPITIRSIDRSFKDIAAWWTAVQTAESTYYPNRSELFDIYATVLMDGHLSGIIDKRIKNTLNKKILFNKKNKPVEGMEALLKSEAFKNLRKWRFQKVFYGLYGFEFIPGADFTVQNIPLKHINPEIKKITKEQWGTDGFGYENVWNLLVYGQREELGLLAKLAPYAIWKKGNMGDWAQYIEVFGQPMIIFTYDAHDAKSKAQLDEAMRLIGSGTKLQVPKQVELKLEDGKQNNGDGELQDKFRRACNEEMSVLVLGVTETTTSSRSSGYAQAESHSKQQDEIIKDDMDEELKFLNSPAFFTILKSYGLPVEGGEFCHEEEADINHQKGEIDIDEKLEKIGLPLGHDYYYEKYNRPKPANYDELVAKKEADKIATQNAHNTPADPAKKQAAKKPEKQPAKVPDNSAAAPDGQQEEDTLTWLERFRLKLADFFNPAH